MSTKEMDEMQSSQSAYVSAPALANSRYNRQMLIPAISIHGQERISSTRVLIIGLGGLGSPASLYLAGAGIHTLGLLDHDVVEESNLHRQIVHRESSVFVTRGSEVETGSITPLTKVQSALRGCRDLNSTIQYRTHEERLNGSNALDIIRDYDIVLDCTDNPATRYLISDVCVILNKTLVSGAAQRIDGQVMVLNYTIPPLDSTPVTGESGVDISPDAKPSQKGPCYRCVFPVPPSPEMVQGCSEIGILGPVVGTIGCLMASEALRLICKPDEIRKPTMLLYNAWSTDPRGMFRTIGLRGQRQDCVSCGDPQVLQSKGKQKLNAQEIREGVFNYETFCGRVEDVHILRDEERINAETFFEKLQSDDDSVVVDVREQVEVELGPKLHKSINLPISKILRSGGTNGYTTNGQTASAEWDTILNNSKDGPVYFVCQRGNDSQIAARKLLDHMSGKQERPSWVGDVKGGFIAIEKYASDSQKRS